MATLREVAQLAGVSEVTVSNALNGRIKGVRKGAAARVERIRAAARRVGYRPHGGARAMARGRFGSVGVLLSEHPYRGVLTAGLLEGLDAAAREHDLHLTLGRLPDAELADANAVPKLLTDWLCDGLIVNWHMDIPASLRDRIADAGVPAVWLNCLMDTDCVRPDDHGAGVEAARRLLDAGHRRLVYVDLHLDPTGREPHHYSRSHRPAGVQAAVEDAGARVTVIGRVGTDWEAAAGRLADLLRRTPGRRPTAVVTYSDDAAALARHVAAQAGLDVPVDLSLVTFRDEQAGVPVMSRASAMRVPQARVGRGGVDMVMARFEGGDPVPARLEPFDYEDLGTVTPPR